MFTFDVSLSFNTTARYSVRQIAIELSRYMNEIAFCRYINMHNEPSNKIERGILNYIGVFRPSHSNKLREKYRVQREKTRPVRVNAY